ncbi:SagB/ThcOx family dehydrogenase [bacterium]|nr:SagB/ThcOx family dehydrogenase [bacterium]
MKSLYVHQKNEWSISTMRTFSTPSLLILSFFIVTTIAAGEELENCILLPSPKQSSECSLEELLWERHSTRSFTNQELTMEEIGQLCWAAQGVNRPEEKKRTAPSAGATYPLELYVVLPDGVYHYIPATHELELKKEGSMRPLLVEADLDSKMMQVSQCVFIFTAVFERTVRKYGGPSFGYVYLEAGHAAQNLLLQAQALQLGGVPNGSVISYTNKQKLGIPASEDPIYLLVIGHPKEE